MKLTLEITVESHEDYLQLLNALDRADESGELGFERTARPSLDTLSRITTHEAASLY